MWIDHQQAIAKDGDVVEVDVLVDRLREWDMLASEQKQDMVAVRGEMPEDELIILKIKQPKREKDKLEEDIASKMCNVIANFYNEMLSEACQAYKTSWSKIFPYMGGSKQEARRGGGVEDCATVVNLEQCFDYCVENMEQDDITYTEKQMRTASPKSRVRRSKTIKEDQSAAYARIGKKVPKVEQEKLDDDDQDPDTMMIDTTKPKQQQQMEPP